MNNTKLLLWVLLFGISACVIGTVSDNVHLTIIGAAYIVFVGAALGAIKK